MPCGVESIFRRIEDVITQTDQARGDRYKAAREHANLTQVQLAEAITKLVQRKLGSTAKRVSQQAVAAVEKGKTRNPWYRGEWAELTGKQEAWLEFGLEDLDQLDQDAVAFAVEYQGLPEDAKELIHAMVKSVIQHNKKD